MTAPIRELSAQPIPPEPPRPGLELTVIGLGGALGSSLRFAVSRSAAFAGIEGFLATASVNLVGAFLLGLSVGLLEARRAHPLLRPFLTIGVFGSFTTFSALALENHDMLDARGVGAALGHLTATIFFGLSAFALGRWVARRAGPLPLDGSGDAGEGTHG